MATDKESKLNQIEKTAQHYEEIYHGCSRCVFKALQEHLNLGDGAAVKAATPFAAGGYVECPKVVGKIARMTGEFILEYRDGKK